MTATSVVRLGTKAAAEYLGGLPESTLRYWRYLGTSPRSYRLGRHTFCDIADLDAWVEAEAAKIQRGGVGE
ncbi:helix-turn-helix transcriptional regulator [Mycobacterium canetti]|uniref:helix-turn-helix transcriptional regulator n=1 Tax=Mycobacterium canetti TaxID=78331 RepID=UPI00031D036C|nr:helix-turn-helix domain-containing protein [Mycobacterium canetti]